MNADYEAEQYAKSKSGWRTRLWALKLQAKEVWLRVTASFVYWRIKRRCQAWKTGIVSMSRAEAERCGLVKANDAEFYTPAVETTVNLGGSIPVPTEQEAQKILASESELEARMAKWREEMHKPVKPDICNLEWQQVQERLKNENT